MTIDSRSPTFTETATMTVTPNLELSLLAGRRISHNGLTGVLRVEHCPQPRYVPAPGLVGAMVHDAHGDCRGGHTAVYIPYGDDIRFEAAS